MQIFTRILSVAVAAAAFSMANSASAQQLFANQYTQGYANQATAQMYLSPTPVPQWVGHTYITYEPLYPHQMMYHHTDRYHHYYDNGRGLNSTRVHYGTSPIKSSVHGAFKALSLPRP